MTTLTLPKIATAKSVDEKTYKELSGSLEPGQHLIDCSVRLRGVLKKGTPFKTPVPAAANPWRLLALALSKLNVVSIESLVREALEASDETADAVKKEAQEAIERIVAATERESSGRITGNVIWELLA
jgi:hypothetical protein